MDEDQDLFLPNWMIAEALEEHLVLSHGAKRDRIEAIRDDYEPNEWTNLMVKSHYILHTLDKYGEYEDGQMRFES